MEKYRVYFASGRIEEIFGYSEDDALIRYKIKRNQIESIRRIYV